MLPPGSAEPGPFRSSRTPYMIPFARAFQNTRYRELVAVVATQQGKTATVANIIGQRLADKPVPMLYIGPTRKFVEETWEPQFMAMVESSKSLATKFTEGKAQRKTMKLIAGVKVRFGWAGSSTSLAGEPACKVFVDEYDRMDADVEGEGDPVELAHGRHATYADGQVAVISTPTMGTVTTERNEATGLLQWAVQTDTDAIQSPVWRRWQEGTRHEWMWTCPHCHDPFAPRLELLRWPEDSAEKVYQVTLACPYCGAEITEAEKSELNANGLAVAPGQKLVDGALVGDAPDVDVFSLWISGLCSPWRSWLVSVRRLLRAREAGDADREKAVLNTDFAELYSLVSQVTPWQVVAQLRSPYRPGQLPAEARVLTCGVDVQKRRLVYTVRAWGPDLASWGIEMDEMWGETDQQSVWGTLGSLLSKTWDGVPISAMFVDSGYRPGDKWKRPEHMVYSFCRRFPTRAWPTKGHDTLEKPLRPSRIDVVEGGRKIPGAVELWHVNSDFFKAWVHARLMWPIDQKGRWLIHEETTDDYCKQIVSEVRVAVGTRIVWNKLREENHYLDAESLAIAAAYRLNLHINMPSVRSGPPQQNAFGRRRVISKGVE